MAKRLLRLEKLHPDLIDHVFAVRQVVMSLADQCHCSDLVYSGQRSISAMNFAVIGQKNPAFLRIAVKIVKKHHSVFFAKTSALYLCSILTTSLGAPENGADNFINLSRFSALFFGSPPSSASAQRIVADSVGIQPNCAACRYRPAGKLS